MAQKLKPEVAERLAKQYGVTVEVAQYRATHMKFYYRTVLDPRIHKSFRMFYMPKKDGLTRIATVSVYDFIDVEE